MPDNAVITDNYVKAWNYINRPTYEKITCSISGGSDSDIVLDICCRCDKDKKITYVFYDTGVEYQATKKHLDYLENLYGIEIKRIKAAEYGKTIPTSCREYGQPFISKFASECMMRLQMHDFKWENDSYENLIRKYPMCSSALKWWCDDYGDGSRFGISRNKYLKEFIIQNPPTFRISNKCCKYAKKMLAEHFVKENKADLNIVGVRKLEGGARSTAYKSCFSNGEDKTDSYRPIFWYSDSDKRDYEKHFGIVHSDCYTVYGLRRTGCVGCPYGLNLEQELEATRINEPKLYKAVCNIFKDSYEYTRQYRKFSKKMSEAENGFTQIKLEDL